jgi:beta-lactamase superfamily II metal-dependent hydrolase
MRQRHLGKVTFPERRLIAFVSRVERIGDSERARTSFEFDSIDEKVTDGNVSQTLQSDDVSPFAQLRVLTTEHRFVADFDRIPAVGDWYELEISPDKPPPGQPRLPTWHAQLSDAGYVSHSRGYLRFARYLLGGGEPTPSDLGAASDPAIARARRVAKALEFPSAVIKRKDIKSTLKAIEPPSRIVVHDVGQAAFVSFLNAAEQPVMYYDAGWPISYNRHTALKKKQILCNGAPLILSHWDWDHMHGYYRFPNIRLSTWIAPVQKVGPGSGRIIKALFAAKKIIGFKGDPINFKWGSIGLVKGKGGNNNQTGIAVRVELDCGRKALLVGDADYQNLPNPIKGKPVNFLVFTHHGAKFNGQAPTSIVDDRKSVISYGKRNTYKHPKRSAIQEHAKVGWKPLHTAATQSSKRGDRRMP